MSKAERRAWSQRVDEQLTLLNLPSAAEIIFLAGIPYRAPIEPFLKSHGFEVTVPLRGLRVGEQLRWLNQANRSSLG